MPEQQIHQNLFFFDKLTNYIRFLFSKILPLAVEIRKDHHVKLHVGLSPMNLTIHMRPVKISTLLNLKPRKQVNLLSYFDYFSDEANKNMIFNKTLFCYFSNLYYPGTCFFVTQVCFSTTSQMMSGLAKISPPT